MFYYLSMSVVTFNFFKTSSLTSLLTRSWKERWLTNSKLFYHYTINFYDILLPFHERSYIQLVYIFAYPISVGITSVKCVFFLIAN